MMLVVRAPTTYAEERRYVVDVVVSEWLGLDYEIVFEEREDTTIRLAGDPGDRVLTIIDSLFANPLDSWLTERSLPGAPPPGTSMPVLFGYPSQDGMLWAMHEDRATFTVDILGSVFFMITRYEEIVVTGEDAHGRFAEGGSFVAAAGFAERPIVDEYVDQLWGAMSVLWPQLLRRQASFRLRLTHDVDRPWAALGNGVGVVAHAIAGDIVRRRDPILAARRIRSVVDARAGRVDRDPFNTFDLLMDTSERHGLTSTFYFMTGTTDPRFDASYGISDPPIQRLLRQIHARGHLVGLHASYDTFQSVELMQTEFDSLRAACDTAGFDQESWGVRQHYLRFAASDTWRIQANVGLAHDSTIGFNGMNGFRAGTCREYPVFDLRTRTRLELRERPLIVMDAASDEYLAMDLDAAAASMTRIVDLCRRHAGDAVVLFHNSSLPSGSQQAHYRELISALAQPR